MEALTLDLRPQPASPMSRLLQRIILLLIGVVNVIQGVSLHKHFRYVSLAAGIFVVGVALFYDRIYRSKILTFGADEISGALEDSEQSMLPWKNIRRMEFRPYTLTIVATDGQNRKIDLSNITMHQERETVPKVMLLARLKGVDVAVL